MDNKQTIEALKEVLADSYALYLKTQNYHWNVEGPHFKTLHLLFEEQYTDLATAVDEIAELIRGLGAKSPGTFKEFEALSKIKDGNATASAEDMVKELADDQDNIALGSIQKAFDAASEAGDEVVIGALTERMTIHRKNKWMLNSSI